jgi:Ca-activated chloride channel family protein
MTRTWRNLFVATALAALAIGCEGPDSGGLPPDATGHAPNLRFDHYGVGVQDDRTGAPQPETLPGLAIPGDRPSSGAFFNDGIEGDVRARTENFFARLQDVDEVVVVERSDGSRAEYGADRIAALRAVVDGDANGRALPLERTDVRGDVALNVASVAVTQVYTNPFATKIEAVYVFPLPQDAAVSDFVMVIGERRIRGIVREREEAQRIYAAARAQGYQASLLSQERPNLFTQRVANIEPGQRIDVEITYFQTLTWGDGAFEMAVPTVVGPRFDPPGATGGVGAVAAGAEGTSGQATEVGYLPPAEAGAHRLTLEVKLDLGMPIGTLACDTHPVRVTRDGDRRATVALRDGVDVPNRDFVLRFAPAGTELRGAVAVHRDPESQDGWFTMLLQPPLEQIDVPPQPREMIFVVDCSGSMSGEPLAVCKRTIRRCLERLGPDDTFQVIRFSDDASLRTRGTVPATPDEVRDALRFVDRLEANGGTMMERGIVAALAHPAERGRRRIVTFMTDGFIGNETDILRAVHTHVGDARIFSFGVGSAPNRYLLERMASLGRGVAAYVGLDASGQAEVDALFARLERPALADLEIDWRGAELEGLIRHDGRELAGLEIEWRGADVYDLEPQRLPDLFVGRPLVIHGRVRGDLPATVQLRGRVGAQPFRFDLEVGAPRAHPALVKLWARARIRSLADAMTFVATPDELASEIEALALQHGLASAYTSFVAVDASQITDGDHGTTVRVPAEMPRGVRYEPTVTGSR